MTETTIPSSLGNCNIRKSGYSAPTIYEDGGGSAVFALTRLGYYVASSEYYTYEAFGLFDTSVIPDEDIITNAELKVNIASNATTVDTIIQARIRDFGGTVTTGDWNITGLPANPLVATLNTAAINIGWNSFISEAEFLAQINKSGTTPIILFCQELVNQNLSGPGDIASSFDLTGVPTLVVTHGPAPSNKRDAAFLIDKRIFPVSEKRIYPPIP